MRILESSPDRLRLFLGGWGIRQTICTFDRRQDRAVIIRMAFLVPFRITRLPLSAFQDVTVQGIGREQDRRYYLALRPGRGRKLRIGQRAKKEAMDAFKAIQGFLTLQ